MKSNDGQNCLWHGVHSFEASEESIMRDDWTISAKHVWRVSVVEFEIEQAILAAFSFDQILYMPLKLMEETF